MGNPVSVLDELLREIPALRPQMYFKTSLTALSHAMEDQVLAGRDRPLMIASFQQERFYRQEAHRYVRLSELSPDIYVFSAAGTQFDAQANRYETIAFDPDDALVNEWHLVVLGAHYSACLVCREHQPAPGPGARLPGTPVLDQTRRFEGVWTLDSQVSQRAASILLDRVVAYRPSLAEQVERARQQYIPEPVSSPIAIGESDPFAQRLVTYVQASQYKLLKAYKAIAIQSEREQLINSITAAIRQSLNPSEIFAIATRELAQVLSASRCLIYRYSEDAAAAPIQREYRQPGIVALMDSDWSLLDHPLFEWVRRHRQTLMSNRPVSDLDPADIHAHLSQWEVSDYLLVPLIYQERLLGAIELHQCKDIDATSDRKAWSDTDVDLVESIATQLSVALIQAEAYGRLAVLNQQLADLERTRSNLIAITGHELRTPLSTIRVCLESLNTEPDMPLELQQVMLSSALSDADRMQNLVQDFLTLSRLESGRIEWNLESLSLEECVALALSSVRSTESRPLPTIKTDLADSLPFIRADGEWIVEVLSKVIDNACKFTDADGEVVIQAQPHTKALIKVSISDTGRGIEPDRLEAVFDRFYQEEGALRRSVGGTGLGLAICRQIIEAHQGQIWATSAGKNQGTQIHFTLPVARPARPARSRRPRRKKVSV
ncbi:MAG: DICT sensory domain-containing protein [Cyanobacteria bacterium J06628_6]